MEEKLLIFRTNYSEASIKKQISHLKGLLNELVESVMAFSDEEIDYLQNSYIELSQDMLEIGVNFKNTKYFFLAKNFKENISTNYGRFVFRDEILNLEEYFKKESKENSPQEQLSNPLRDIVSLFTIIENISRKMEHGTLEFKIKLIRLYNALYYLLQDFSDTLAAKFFDVALANHPAILTVVVKSTLKANSLKSAIENFSSDSIIKEYKNSSIDTLDEAILAKFISIISILNPNFSSLVYKNNTLKALNLEPSSGYDKFEEISKDFILKHQIFSDLSKPESIIAVELFLNFATKQDVDNISKNILLIGPLSSGKSKIASSMVDSKRSVTINLSKSHTYQSIIDGFVNGKFVDGEFKQMCKKAINDRENSYYIILNNIQNADTEQLFAEIISLFNNRYDGSNDSALIRSVNSHIIDSLENPSEYSVVYKNSKSYFTIPDNLYIIATYSLNLKSRNYDLAIMNKFSIMPVECNYSTIEAGLSDIKNSEIYIDACKKLNEYLAKISPSAKVGHFAFLKIKDQIKGAQITSKDLPDFFQKELVYILSSLLADLPKDEAFNAINRCAEIFEV